MQRTNPWLSAFAKLLVVATFGLIFLGGMVTSKQAGLSVPDWPTSYGYNMFTFPVTRWIGGILFEHTHRLLASCVGLITTILAAWIWRNRRAVPAAFAVMIIATATAGIAVKHIAALAGLDHEMTRKLIVMHVNIWSFAATFVLVLLTTERDRWRYGKPWLQWLAFWAFLLVCVQGTLGGLRVTEVSIVLAMIHACTAQAFLCMTVIMAAALSPRWGEAVAHQNIPSARLVKVLSWTLVAAIYCQLMIGAVVRHLHAGLAIRTFPLANGRLVPPLDDPLVAIHFAHRVGALVVTLLALGLAMLIFTVARRYARLARTVAGLIAAVAVQVILGACAVAWMPLDPILTSLHVVNGAAVLATALLLAIRAAALLQPETDMCEEMIEARA